MPRLLPGFCLLLTVLLLTASSCADNTPDPSRLGETALSAQVGDVSAPNTPVVDLVTPTEFGEPTARQTAAATPLPAPTVELSTPAPLPTTLLGDKAVIPSILVTAAEQDKATLAA